MDIVGIIFLLVSLIIVAALVISAKQALIPDKNILLGVTLPNYMLQDEEVNRIKEGYRKKTNLFLLFPIILLLPMIIINIIYPGYPSLVLVCFSIWLVFIFAAYYKIITAANKQLSDYKKKAIPLSKYAELSIPADADDHWIKGLFYYNRNDDSLTVPARIGTGNTINLGRTKGKAFMVGGIIFAAVLLISISAFLLVYDFYVPSIQVSKNSIVIKDLDYSTSCTVSDVEDVSLANSIPVIHKVNGGETAVYARGIFRVEGYDRERVYIFKNSSPYIIIKLKDQYIIYNTKNKNETIEEYNKIKAEIAK